MRPMLASILLATFALGACAQAPTGLRPSMRTASGLAVRAESEADTLLADVGEQAKALQKDVEATYVALGLNTASGRKLTPARELTVKAGLAPFLMKLDTQLGGCISRLQGDERYASVVAELAQRKPALGDALPETATATDMLYRLAQYRLKLGVLIEYAVRQGAVLD